MLLRKYMSKIGIGSATVDLVLDKETYSPGEKVTGTLYIKGGTITQKIKQLQCDLMKINNQADQQSIASITLFAPDIIDPADCAKIPFEFVLPKHLPATTDSLTYRFKTTLVFEEGIDSLDHDTIQILKNKPSGGENNEKNMEKNSVHL
ncbi:sporulation protein [Aeribacillus composti]|uniref:sporulation protein n=1 Tax=Aeribacillus composti TaxID=1868734 RepID=UPI002E2190A5|nr:sporulation protein [Aeribacillus composti]